MLKEYSTGSVSLVEIQARYPAQNLIRVKLDAAIAWRDVVLKWIGLTPETPFKNCVGRTEVESGLLSYSRRDPQKITKVFKRAVRGLQC